MWNQQVEDIFHKAVQMPRYPHEGMELKVFSTDSSFDSSISKQTYRVEVFIRNTCVYYANVEEYDYKLYRADCMTFRPGKWVDYLMNYKEPEKPRVDPFSPVDDGDLFP